jgi:hypothetical protein
MTGQGNVVAFLSSRWSALRPDEPVADAREYASEHQDAVYLAVPTLPVKRGNGND